MTFSVTKNGKLLDPNLYDWDEQTKTFVTYQSNLVLDFSGIDNVTFRTGPNCMFKTCWGCTFTTGDFCTFKTGWDCAFKTGSHCTFNTESRCSFESGSYCTFDTGEKCTLTYNSNDCFEVYKLEPNKLVLLLGVGKLKSLLGHIPTKPYNVIWWKENQEIIIKVGCQEHSLNHWKKNYEQIAKENGFQQDLIPEFLQHLETIESSLSKTSSTKQERNSK